MRSIGHVQSIHHVCFVVTSRAEAEKFYMETLGLPRHHQRANWYNLNATSTLHLLEVAESKPAALQHFALLVGELRPIVRLLLAGGYAPFQMEVTGNPRPISDPDGDLEFGLGTVFVRDPSGNLVEFINEKGMFGPDARPQAYPA